MSEKILFVDDERAILDGYRRLLRGEYEFDIALGPTLALEMLAKQSYAVVIADMRMPEMDGAQLLAKIAAQYPGTIRVMLTGNSDMQTAVRAVNEGAVFRFLTKPCDKELLRTTIQAALAQYRLSGLQQENLGTTAPPKAAKKKAGDPALVEIEEQCGRFSRGKLSAFVPPRSPERSTWEKQFGMAPITSYRVLLEQWPLLIPKTFSTMFPKLVTT